MKNIVKYRSHSRIENIKGVLEEKDIQYETEKFNAGLFCLFFFGENGFFDNIDDAL